MVRISVVVPSYRSFATIGRTLDSLFRQTGQTFLKEVIVVDSSDDEATRRVLDGAKREGLRVIRLGEKAMPAIGRNRGAREASGEVLAFIDSDAYADEKWLETIAAAYDRGSRVGGGSILLPPEQWSRPLALAQYFLQFNEFMGGSTKNVPFAPSCNLFCEKGLFDQLNGFPEVRASEDVLFGLKAGEVSPFLYDPAVKVYHIFMEDWKRYVTNQRMLGKYVLVYRRMTSRSWIYKGFVPFFLLPAFLVVKFLRITGRILASGSARTLFSFVWTLPFFLVGFFSWARGFGEACFEHE